MFDFARNSSSESERSCTYNLLKCCRVPLTVFFWSLFEGQTVPLFSQDPG